MAIETGQSRALTVDFDAEADVLYISLGAPVPGYAEEADHGLLLRRSNADDRPCGVTAIDFRQNWRDRNSIFCALVAEFLCVPVDLVAGSIKASI